jgi:hypothetical protein
MINEQLLTLIDEAINLKNQIKEIESGRLASLQSMLNVVKMKITSEMKAANLQQAESNKGKVSLVESEGKSMIDNEAIMNALGLNSLDAFKKTGKPYSYLLINEL